MIKYKQQMGQMAVKVPFFNLSSSSLAHDYSSSASLTQLFQVSLYHRGWMKYQLLASELSGVCDRPYGSTVFAHLIGVRLG